MEAVAVIIGGAEKTDIAAVLIAAIGLADQVVAVALYIHPFGDIPIIAGIGHVVGFDEVEQLQIGRVAARIDGPVPLEEIHGVGRHTAVGGDIIGIEPFPDIADAVIIPVQIHHDRPVCLDEADPCVVEHARKHRVLHHGEEAVLTRGAQDQVIILAEVPAVEDRIVEGGCPIAIPDLER